MALVQAFVSNDGKELLGTLTTGRQQNMRKMNRLGEIVNNEDASQSCEVKDDYDSSTYILNEKLQVSVGKTFIQSIFKFPYLNSRNYHLKNRTQADILLADKM